jgi:hypothetical protein
MSKLREEVNCTKLFPSASIFCSHNGVGTYLIYLLIRWFVHVAYVSDGLFSMKNSLRPCLVEGVAFFRQCTFIFSELVLKWRHFKISNDDTSNDKILTQKRVLAIAIVWTQCHTTFYGRNL